MKTPIRRYIFYLACVFTLNFLFPINSFAQSNLCTTPTALNSVAASNCVNLTGQTLLGKTQSSPNVTSGTCGGTAGADVWYSFVAQSTNPTVALSSIGTSLQAAGTRVQVLSGTCPSGFTSIACAGGTGTTLSVNPTTLTINQTYFVRVFTPTVSPAGSAVNWGYSICISNPTPGNEDCAGAIVLTSSTSCVTPVEGNLGPANNSAVTINAPNCASTVFDDLWYSFVAQTTNPTITLGGLVGFANPGIQLLDNNCGGTFTALFCGTTSIAANFLTPGTTYYIRVYSTTNITGSAAFDICVTDPVSTAANDNCTGAANLSVNNACNNVPGDMAGATPSAPALNGSCPGPLVYDVWYKFTAINNTATITLSNLGTKFVNPGIEVFSGTCGSLTSVACGVNPLTMSGTLITGNVYYVRVYSRTAPAPNGDARFDICVSSSVAPVVRFGNSYVNISRKTTGGVVQPGDTLEIRMAIQHSSGTTMTNLRYVDNIPTKTSMLTGVTDRIRILTNEGLVYKQYTLAAGDDAATYVASPPGSQYNIRMNLGFAGSSAGIPVNNTSTEIGSATGTMKNTNRPTLWGGSLLFVTAYRVKVTGVVGDTIILNPARFIYRAGGPDIVLTGTPYKILISSPLTLCTNSIGVNIAAESGGTFGSGTAPNRGTDLTNPITGYSFVNNVTAYNSIGDGTYAIIKNISPRNSTNKNANFARSCPTLAFNDPFNCNNRMHGGHWYIDGDHTGTSNAAGNAPPAATTSAGYMLEVNADYVASQVYSQTLNNLCPNTYYEFSTWFRNICPTCGADSTGAQFAGTVTAPSSGYPGVKPNLSFALDGLDYYSTGELDTVGWIKKGFVFKTGVAQTSASFSIRNNSQGGGGNDWVMDDIAVATCLPTMSYSPTINPNVCRGNAITIADTISSFFKNYTTYKWQRSTNGGASWTDITAVTTLPDTNYYITTFTVPPANTTQADSGNLYRVVVATTAANLTDPNCNISNGVTITLSTTNCGIPLKVDLLSFNGKLVIDKGNLSWTTSQEDEPVTFTIERSNDGDSFVPIGTVSSHNNYAATVNSYSFIDPVAVTGKVFYRLAIRDAAGAIKYSRIIIMKLGGENIGLSNIVNPFNHSIEFNITAQGDSKVEVELISLLGKTVMTKNYTVHTGINALTLPDTENLPAGIYIFRVKNNEMLINRKVMKKNF